MFILCVCLCGLWYLGVLGVLRSGLSGLGCSFVCGCGDGGVLRIGR